MLRLSCIALALASSLAAAGCSGTSRPIGGSTQIHYPEILVVNDYARYQALGDATETDSSDMMNLASGYFSHSPAFVVNRVQFLLVGQVTIITPSQDFLAPLVEDGHLDPVAALQAFASYQADLGTRIPHDAAILLTARPLTPPTVEVAYTGTMCDASLGAAVVHTGYSRAFDSSSIAHVVGHLLGMCHDPPNGASGCATLPSTASYSEAACSNGIMSASSNPANPYDRFSTCSAFYLDDFVSNRMPAPTCMGLPAQGP